MADRKRVLSIQSHVVHGYVGNKCSTFPLQLLGYDVDVINSVQYSNHTGYPNFKGHVLDSRDLRELIDGLQANKLLKQSHILTGYIGNKSFLQEVKQLVIEMKNRNPQVSYVCDPVLGDKGVMYVPVELLPIYKEEILPLADIITPNQFEAELLSGIEIKTEEDGWKAIDLLLSKGIRTVIITSVSVTAGRLVLLGGSKEGENVRLEFDELEGYFTGTGDLFSALFLAWSEEGLQTACEKTVGTMQAVLRRTVEHSKLSTREGQDVKMEDVELQLVASKKDIEDPPSIS